MRGGTEETIIPALIYRARRLFGRARTGRSGKLRHVPRPLHHAVRTLRAGQPNVLRVEADVLAVEAVLAYSFIRGYPWGLQL